ncbi:hypothetical protein H5410_042867 [Solanum commersonii]|uniref:Uncharacterized protein n=1 Tax=Solanum commersonii TaxID=4109 RepID=A0A9J5XVX6_SOLCO|nr:hypothetical protein H5410_042867 [Solanum commersonii]
MLCDSASSGKLGLESQHNSSICNSEDESSMGDVTASACDNLVHDADDTAEIYTSLIYALLIQRSRVQAINPLTKHNNS